jgi:hypothetical protein
MSDWTSEIAWRQEHLDALPGKTYYEWLDSLNRASMLFVRNSADLVGHLNKFVGTSVYVMDLPSGFDFEAGRLLLNYLAALASLRDVQRMVHHKLWPEREEKAHACDTCGRSNSTRTKWESEIWDPKLDELLGDQRVTFLNKLRDYVVHYGTPRMTVTSQLQAASSQSAMEMTNAVGISREELLKWRSWSSRARSFIVEHDQEAIELLPLVNFYSERVREFALWFVLQIEGKVGLATREYVSKRNDFQTWYGVHEAYAQYRVVHNGEYHRRRVNARLARAAVEKHGWRIITSNAAGECVAGESRWPTPPDPR